MEGKKKALSSIFSFFMMMLTFCLFVQGAAQAAEPIKIGICKPFTGPVGYLGQDQKPGYEMALEEINSAGGVLGRPLKLIYADNQCNPTEGVNAIRKLIDLDKVVATIAGACSSVTLAIMPIVQEAKVPNLTISSSNPRITQLAGVGGNTWEFRLNVDDSIMAKSLGKIIAEKNKKVVIYAPNNDYGRGAAQAYTEVFKTLKVDLQSIEFYDQGQADYRPSLTKVKGLNPDALLLVSESRDAAVLVRQMKESGFRPRLYARGSVVTTEFAKAIKDDCSLGEGTVEATLTAYGVYPEWDKNFEKKFGVKPHLGAPQGYTGLKVMAKAIELGGKAEPEAIRQGLKKINITDKIMGPIQFDDHNQAHTWMTITTMKNCEVQLLQVIPTDK